ncbi:hypothetical protein HAX54_037978, partial [Datura stramonium]|nr:hypothetical protein [Datura stramonium]
VLQSAILASSKSFMQTSPEWRRQMRLFYGAWVSSTSEHLYRHLKTPIVPSVPLTKMCDHPPY